MIVFRHFATDPSQRDVYPLDFEDMSAQRQLSDGGRDAARQLGNAMKKLGFPMGKVFTSRLNRALGTRAPIAFPLGRTRDGRSIL